MCSGTELTGFQRECLRQVLEIPGVELVLRIVDANPPKPSSTKQRLFKLLRVRGALWPVFQILFPLRREPALRPSDASDLLGDIPEIRCTVTKKGKWSEYFSEEDLAQIRSYELDFILKFSFGIVRGEILTAARHGIWSFHHDDPDVYRGGPPAFWEIHDGAPTSGAILQRLTSRLDGGVLLQRCWASTNLASYSGNFAQILWATTHLPARVCRDILNDAGGYVEAAPIKTEAPIYRSPNNRAMLRFFWQTAMARSWEQWQRLFVIEQWRVGVARAPAQDFLDESARPEIEWLSNPGPTQFLADPFAVRVDGDRIEILVERCEHKTDKGVIERLYWSASGGAGELQPAIDDAQHHSYPYILEWEGETYCIPETASEREVALYRKTAAGGWEKRAVLLEGIAGVDATVFRHGGRWWMMLTDLSFHRNGTLSAYYADALTGPWTPHANNPIKSDIRSSRPGGPLFEHRGSLYRPAQDCSRSYGWRLALNRVLELTPTTFAEETLGWREHDPAGPCPHGFHTLVGSGPYTLVDGKRLELSLRMAWFRIVRKLSKLFSR